MSHKEALEGLGKSIEYFSKNPIKEELIKMQESNAGYINLAKSLESQPIKYKPKL